MSDEIEASGGPGTAALAASALDGPVPGAAGHGACANCAAPLSGPFCGQCGQKAHVHRSIAEVFEEFLHGITHFDGKAWKTLPMLLFRPGTLTRDYIMGHRARHIAPVPLFLLVVFTMFLVMSFVPLRDTIGTPGAAEIASDRKGLARAMADIDTRIAEARAAGDTAKVAELEGGRKLVAAVGGADETRSFTDRLTSELTASYESGELKVDTGLPWLDVKVKAALKNPRLVLYKLQTKAYKLSFLLVPLSLPWLWLMFFWRRDVRMYDHAVFALYSISFMSLVFVAASIAQALEVTAPLFWIALMVAVPGAHMFAQLKGAYGLSVAGAGVRTFILMNAAQMTLVLFAAFLLFLGIVD